MTRTDDTISPPLDCIIVQLDRLISLQERYITCLESVIDEATHGEAASTDKDQSGIMPLRGIELERSVRMVSALLRNMEKIMGIEKKILGNEQKEPKPNDAGKKRGDKEGRYDTAEERREMSAELDRRLLALSARRTALENTKKGNKRTKDRLSQ